jgi:hypothetical protein
MISGPGRLGLGKTGKTEMGLKVEVGILSLSLSFLPFKHVEVQV